jgi:integrase
MVKDNNKINFTKAALDALPTPPKGKRAYYYDSKTRGLGISITPTGSKSFIVYRWLAGKPERITLGRYPDLSIEQARRKADEVNGAIAKGDNPNDTRRAERQELTLSQLFNEYVERYAKLHKESWEEDTNQFRRYLTNWGKRKLSTIKKANLQKLHADIGKEKGIYAANRLLALLSIMFNKAIEFELWDKPNPTAGIKKFREKSRERFLQADELPRFFQALADEPNETFRDYFLMSLLTGARRANVQAMRWCDISLERAEWHIVKTKNGSSQTVTLVNEAVALLKQRKANATSDYVFPGTGKTGHLVEAKKGWQRFLPKRA